MTLALATGMLMVGVVLGSRWVRWQWVLAILSTVILGGVMGVSITWGSTPATPFILMFQLIIVVMTWTTPRLAGKLRSEMVALQLAVTSGAIAMCHASNWIEFFIGLELLSIVSIIMTWFGSQKEWSIEASIKYFMWSGTVSAVLVLGVALTILDSGQMVFPMMLTGSTLSLAGFTLVTLALLAKLGVIPFHFWVPDVVAIPHPFVVAFLSIIPKFAILFSLITWLGANTSHVMALSPWLVGVGVVSALGGALVALSQSTPERVLAWSGMAQMGMIWLLVATHSVHTIESSLWVLTVYGVASTAVWFVLDRVGHVDGLGRSSPALALLTGMGVLTLAGIPPLSGFLSKLVIVTELLPNGIGLVGVVVVASLMAAVSYLRLLKRLTLPSVSMVSHLQSTRLLAITFLILLLLAMVQPDILLWPVHWFSHYCTQ